MIAGLEIKFDRFNIGQGSEGVSDGLNVSRGTGRPHLLRELPIIADTDVNSMAFNLMKNDFGQLLGS